MKRVAVGSQNPVKIEAVKLAFEKVWPDETWEVVGVEVDSAVRDQPMSDAESIRGARHRAQTALRESAADFGAGLESGLQKIGDEWFDCGWVVIMDRDGVVGIGSSVRMKLSTTMIDYIMDGVELGKVDDLIFGVENSKHGSGHFGLMTGDALTRTDSYVDAVVAALPRFIHPALYTHTKEPQQKITLCGSIAFYDEMLRVKDDLETQGFAVQLPPRTIQDGDGKELSVQEYYEIRKATTDPTSWVWNTKTKAMRDHFAKLEWADAILVLNYDKNGVPGYIGANTLLEMGLAFHLEKPIYLLNPVPDLPYTEEILGVKPYSLDGNILNLTNSDIYANMAG